MLNRCELIGRLGKDPELSESEGKQPRCTLRLATSSKDRTEWHDVTVFGAQARACAEHLAKGRTVYVEGRIQHRRWKDSEGQKRFKTEIVASSVLFISGRDSARRGPAEIPDEELGIDPAYDLDEADVPEVHF
ncbi:MAG: single-stranded DNA-binding protein [Gemmatimonadota bacterium]